MSRSRRETIPCLLGKRDNERIALDLKAQKTAAELSIDTIRALAKQEGFPLSPPETRPATQPVKPVDKPKDL